VSDPPLRVVIAEDNYLVREDTRRLLEDGGGIDVIAAIGTAEELLDELGLGPESAQDRRVTAVPTFLRDSTQPSR
jgi:hypothetical protein